MNLKACRICHGSSFQRYLNLGFTPPADSFIRVQGLQQPEVYYPLEVCLCLDCGISQLGYTVPPDILYQHDYPYESSTTLAGRTHFFNFATSVVNRFKLGSGSLVIDVGSNVGVLLDGFKENGCRIVGIDPSANIAEIAISRGIETINDFISPQVASQVLGSYGRASVITATNVFAHIDDLDSFMEAIDSLLDDTGVLIIEAPHFLKLVQNLEYDTIYHEHLLYISVRPLNRLFGRFGYEVFDVEEVGIHGGSIRIYVSRSDCHQRTVALSKMLEVEERNGIFDIVRLKQFSEDVAAHRMKLTALLRSLKNEGHTLAGVSAPAKGMTLLNYCRIGTELLDFITEKSRLKIGQYTPGMHIPILPDAALAERRPDYALLLAWNFADEIMGNLKEYREKGGKFIIPIPIPRIV
jgi:SAM-dependent methyltransferase